MGFLVQVRWVFCGGGLIGGGACGGVRYEGIEGREGVQWKGGFVDVIISAICKILPNDSERSHAAHVIFRALRERVLVCGILVCRLGFRW